MLRQIPCFIFGHKFERNLYVRPSLSAISPQRFSIESSCTRCNRLLIEQPISSPRENKRLSKNKELMRSSSNLGLNKNVSSIFFP